MRRFSASAAGGAIDMLHGPLSMKMLAFALPLIASGILQQSFNAVDVAVASRYVGPAALAAVGANGPVLGLMVNLFLGLGIGLNVAVANCIGAGNKTGTRQSVAASMPAALVSSILLVGAGLASGRWLLEILGTPPEILPEALEYMYILIWGAPFLIIYNFGAAILRATGDTRRPFYALIVSGAVNMGVSIVLVAYCGMGVAGVAWGTVVSTAVNAAIIVTLLLYEKGPAKLRLSDFSLGWKKVRRVCAIGLPAGLQSTVFSFSNVFVLSAVNSYGSQAMAGSAAAINFEFYTYFVINAFGQTTVAFTSQNYGAGDWARCRRIFRLGLLFSTVAAVAINFTIAWQSDFFTGIFTSDREVADYAAQRVMAVLIWQFIACYYEMAAQAMRGSGHSLTPALITILGTCVVRVCWVTWLPEGTSFAEMLSVYPLTWTLTTLLMGVAYARLAPGRHMRPTAVATAGSGG